MMNYYHVLHYFPEEAYKFYHEISILSWPNSDGTMTSVTSLKDIDAKIQALNFKNSFPVYETVDAQYSYNLRIIVVVTGSLGGTDDVRKRFTQTFFLAPHEKGYFVLNDVFRWVKQIVILEVSSKPFDCGGDSSATAPLATDSVLPSVTLETKDKEETVDKTLLDKDKEYEMVKELVQPVTLVGNAQTDIYEPTGSPPTGDIGPQSTNPRKSVEGHSIYIRNFPWNANVADITMEFTKFGPINDGGVQLKFHKEYEYRYGFVEFQSLESKQNAIKESPLTIGGRHVLVEEKKSSIRVGSTGNAERFISQRVKFQNSNFRGRGYFDGRRYGRNEFRDYHKLTYRNGRYTEYRYQRVDRSGVGEHASDTGVDKNGL